MRFGPLTAAAKNWMVDEIQRLLAAAVIADALSFAGQAPGQPSLVLEHRPDGGVEAVFVVNSWSWLGAQAR